MVLLAVLDLGGQGGLGGEVAFQEVLQLPARHRGIRAQTRGVGHLLEGRLAPGLAREADIPTGIADPIQALVGIPVIPARDQAEAVLVGQHHHLVLPVVKALQVTLHEGPDLGVLGLEDLVGNLQGAGQDLGDACPLPQDLGILGTSPEEVVAVRGQQSGFNGAPRIQGEAEPAGLVGRLVGMEVQQLQALQRRLRQIARPGRPVVVPGDRIRRGLGGIRLADGHGAAGQGLSGGLEEPTLLIEGLVVVTRDSLGVAPLQAQFAAGVPLAGRLDVQAVGDEGLPLQGRELHLLPAGHRLEVHRVGK